MRESVTLDFEGPNTFDPIWFDGSTETSVTFIPEESGPFEVTSTDGVGFRHDFCSSVAVARGEHVPVRRGVRLQWCRLVWSGSHRGWGVLSIV